MGDMDYPAPWTDQCVQIANSTPYTFKRTWEHEYQMQSWGPFPATIAPGAAPIVDYVFSGACLPNVILNSCGDDGGDVTYSIDGNKSFTYHAGPPYHPVAELGNWTVTNGGKFGNTFQLGTSDEESSCPSGVVFYLKINGSGDALSIVSKNNHFN